MSGYSLNKKIETLEPYDPVEGGFRMHLDANESFLPLPEEVLEAAATSLRTLPLNRYPDPAAAALCCAFAKQYGVPEKNVVAGNGSDELISLLLLGFLEGGDAFATIEPDFSMYAFNGFLNERRHVKIGKNSGYCISPEEVITVCNREQVKLLVFSNPCNPTSVVLDRASVRQIVEGVNGLVVLDEAYMDFSDQSLLPEFDRYDNLVILRTCSKAFGMAGLRLGFAVAGERLAHALRAVKSPYNVNALSQQIGTLVLEKREALAAAVRQIKASAAELNAGLGEILQKYPGAFQVLPGETNFATLVIAQSENATRYLAEQGIAVRLTAGLLRITCGKPEENAAVLQALDSYFGKGL